jgi:2-methylcitrate dehydratase PrpD
VREEHFTAEAVGDAAARALAARVHLEPRAELDEAGARAVVRLRDGSTREMVGDLRLGRDPERLRADLGAKFRALTEARLGRDEARRLHEALSRVDEVEDLTELTGGSGRRGS